MYSSEQGCSWCKHRPRSWMISKLKFLVICFYIVLISSGCVKNLSVAERARRSQSVEKLLGQSVLWMREGGRDSLEHAQSALLLAAELSPSDPRISDGLGCVYWRKGDVPAAEKYFMQAKRLDIFYGRAYVHLALVAQYRGEPIKAKKLLEYALELDPLDYRARNNYAVQMGEELKPGDGRSEKVAQEILKAKHSVRLNLGKRSGGGY